MRNLPGLGDGRGKGQGYHRRRHEVRGGSDRIDQLGQEKVEAAEDLNHGLAPYRSSRRGGMPSPAKGARDSAGIDFGNAAARH